jgi:hypothetical protein
MRAGVCILGEEVEVCLNRQRFDMKSWGFETDQIDGTLTHAGPWRPGL